MTHLLAVYKNGWRRAPEYLFIILRCAQEDEVECSGGRSRAFVMTRDVRAEDDKATASRSTEPTTAVIVSSALS